MIKIEIVVPNNLKDNKLSNWPEFPQQFNPANKKFILDKQIPGCGATTYFLENELPLILCSHRVGLLECKADSDRHIGKVHLFKRHGEDSKAELENNMSKLQCYLSKCMPSPYSPDMVPKILVTIDSLPHVFDVLRERGILQKFTLVSDECQCLITDAPFKEESLLTYTRYLNELERVIFLSATPLDKYLAQIPAEYSDIGQLPYYKLVWPEEALEKPHVKIIPVKSLKRQINQIIRDYKENGYFIRNYSCMATQAVFFFNSVKQIRSAILDNGLDPDDCNIVCANTPANLATLNKGGGVRLTIGSVPKLGEPIKPFTFVTKCSFEGVDFYNTNSMTYIFANPNRENLLVDIASDIPQILGRQRLPETINPWKNWAYIYTLDSDEPDMTEAEFQQRVQDKENITATKIREYYADDEKGRAVKREDNKRIKATDGYTRDYLQFATDPNTKEVIAMSNFTVRLCEQRAWDIKTGGYLENLRVFAESSSVQSNPVVTALEGLMASTGSFQYKMKYYLDYCEHYPELANAFESSVDIDPRYPYYYHKLGPERIRANSCQESLLKRLLIDDDAEEQLKDCIQQAFKPGEEMSNKTAKERLQKIYDGLGMGRTAKATDLKRYFSVDDKAVTIDGKRTHGIRLGPKMQ